MKELNELLKIRKELKKKKPNFMRQDAHKRKRLKTSWRRSRGSQSKMRLELKGYRRNIEIGWGSPRKVHGLSKEGLKKITVNNVKDLKKLDSKKEGAVISGSVGLKKRVEIIKEAEILKIKILNIKYPQKLIKDSEESMKKRKEDKKELDIV